MVPDGKVETGVIVLLGNEHKHQVLCTKDDEGLKSH